MWLALSLALALSAMQAMWEKSLCEHNLSLSDLQLYVCHNEQELEFEPSLYSDYILTIPLFSKVWHTHVEVIQMISGVYKQVFLILTFNGYI